MIDANNVPNDHLYGSNGKAAAGILNTDTSRIPSSGGRGRRSPSFGAAEYAGIPLPSELKAHHEILMLIMQGET